MANKVPDALVREANAVSRDVIAGKIKSADAAKALGDRYGVEAPTTEAHIIWYCAMRTGKRIRRTVSADAARIILEAIAEDGQATLLVALDALWEHIVYRNKPQVDLRALHAEFEGGLSEHASLDHISRKLARDVNRALQDTAEARAARLEKAGRKPEPMIVMTRVFKRNPDIIATVLLRAKGFCEGGGSPAPFKRVNGRPFLEVHHKTRLADGGDDTPENAFALCPNCHRERHFGAAHTSDAG